MTLCFIYSKQWKYTSSFFVHILEGITILENCTDVYVFWKPVAGALQYRLRFTDTNGIFLNMDIADTLFRISLKDSEFNDKVFSIEVCLPTLMLNNFSNRLVVSLWHVLVTYLYSPIQLFRVVYNWYIHVFCLGCYSF